MTISYAGEVPNGSSFGCFWRILLKWRGSVYKLVWRELLAYLCLYYSINLIYRYSLNDDQKRIFEKVRQYFGAQGESIPMSFVLGFYVSLVVKRWWEQYKLLPWPDTLALFISAAIPGNVRRCEVNQNATAQNNTTAAATGTATAAAAAAMATTTGTTKIVPSPLLPPPSTINNLGVGGGGGCSGGDGGGAHNIGDDDLNPSSGTILQHETGRLMRRNIMRYSVLAYVITLMRISLRVKRRFPSWQHLVDAGLMLESERKIFEIMDGKSPMSKYWMPLVWATNIINRARKDGLITSDHIVQTLLVELSDIRKRLGALIGYDTVCVPLVYTQVVTLVLYTYFIAALMGRQMVPRIGAGSDKYEDPDLYFPLFTALQFCFYVGWLKVAEVLINPFGEDDDDIELNWLIDRHIKASYMIVDEMHEEHPELLKDQYWEEVVPKDLPYTVASEHYRKDEPKGSAEQYKVKQADAVYANIIPAKRALAEDVYADYESVDTPMVERRKNWFSRQITRMGSARSSSTAYSSGGLFSRNRHNSVYSSPEAGLAHPQQTLSGPLSHKMSLYEKFVGRKSVRAQRQLMKQNSKLSLNGSIISAVPLRNRPRIPTPDVTKEMMDKEGRSATLSISASVANTASTVASGVALMTQQLANTPSMYPTSMHNSENMPVVGTLLLSPIKELDTGSVNNTLHAGHPTTAALAKAIMADSHPLGVFSLSGGSGGGSSSSNSPSTVSMMQLPTTTASGITLSPPEMMSVAISTVPITTMPCLVSPTATIGAVGGLGNVIVTELPADTIDSAATITSYPKESISRKTSDATPYFIERKTSLGSKGGGGGNDRDSVASMRVTTTNSLMPGVHYPELSVSAPSTLTKAKAEAKTGEVYV